MYIFFKCININVCNLLLPDCAFPLAIAIDKANAGPKAVHPPDFKEKRHVKNSEKHSEIGRNTLPLRYLSAK